MKIIMGENFDESIFNSIGEIDRICYKEEYRGTYEKEIKRYLKEKNSLITLFDNNKLVGYLQIFAMTDELLNDILYVSKTIRDDDITDTETKKFTNGDNVYLFSICILPEYRDASAIIMLTTAMNDFLKEKNCKSLFATTVSHDGEKVALRLGLKFIRKYIDGTNLYGKNFY